MTGHEFGAAARRAVATIFCIAALVAGTAVTAQTKMRMGLLQPPGSAEHLSAQAFERAVETSTAGAVDIEVVPDSQLLTTATAVKTLEDGGADMGAILIDTLAESVPAFGLFVQPFMFHEPRVLQAAWRRNSAVRRPLEAALLRQHGLRVLWWHPNGIGVILSKGKPLTRADQMTGRKVRAPGGTLVQWIEGCRGAPVNGLATEIPKLMRSGQIEAAMTHLFAVPARRMWEWSDTLSVTRHYVGGIIMVVSEWSWQALPADVRQKIEAVAVERDAASLASMAADEATVLAAATAAGMTIHTTTREDVEAWKLCSATVLGRYADEAGALGDEVMAGYRQVLRQAYMEPAVR